MGRELNLVGKVISEPCPCSDHSLRIGRPSSNLCGCFLTKRMGHRTESSVAFSRAILASISGICTYIIIF